MLEISFYFNSSKIFKTKLENERDFCRGIRSRDSHVAKKMNQLCFSIRFPTQNALFDNVSNIFCMYLLYLMALRIPVALEYLHVSCLWNML